MHDEWVGPSEIMMDFVLYYVRLGGRRRHICRCWQGYDCGHTFTINVRGHIPESGQDLSRLRRCGDHKWLRILEIRCQRCLPRGHVAGSGEGSGRGIVQFGAPKATAILVLATRDQYLSVPEQGRCATLYIPRRSA